MGTQDYEHRRYVTVALNKRGLGDIDHMLMESENIITYPLGSDEFYKLYDCGFLWNLNDHYELMLDDYESGRISSDFDFLKSESKSIERLCPTIYAAIDLACKLGTMVSFDL